MERQKNFVRQFINEPTQILENGMYVGHLMPQY